MPSSDGRVQLPWDVRCSQNKDSVSVVAHTLRFILTSIRALGSLDPDLHLHQELGLDPPCRL